MMPKPNQSRQNKYNTYDNRPSNCEHVLLETRPNILLYSDNFVLKIVVLFLLVFLFAPLITVFYGIQSNLLTTFQINLENMTFNTYFLYFNCNYKNRIGCFRLELYTLYFNRTTCNNKEGIFP